MVGLIALLDDIATLFDDVGVATKLTVQKTASIISDDLAINAEKTSKFKASKELEILLTISKGSFKNKLYILPIIILLTIYFPQALQYILIIGGLYLAFEASEKIFSVLLNVQHSEAIFSSEKDKIKSALITDFILSIEILIVSFNQIKDFNLIPQIIALIFIAILSVIFIYGLVALIIRIDDLGIYLILYSQDIHNHRFKVSKLLDIVSNCIYEIGVILIKSMKYIIHSLSLIGTIAMLLVSGDIFIHNLHLDYYTNLLNIDMSLWYISILVDIVIALNMGVFVFIVFKLYELIKGIFK